MYGITKTGDYGFLVGKLVEQVCLGRYQTQIHLDDARLSIEGKHVLLRAEDQMAIIWERGQFRSDGISKLLGQTVSGVSVSEGGPVEITFSQGDRLLIFDDSHQYESFEIRCGDLWIVV